MPRNRVLYQKTSNQVNLVLDVIETLERKVGIRNGRKMRKIENNQFI